MAWTLSSLKTLSLLQLCLAVTFFLSGLCINLIQLILYVTINPFSDRLFKKINYYLHYVICSELLFLAEWWSGSDCRCHVDKDAMKYFGHEHALLIMNHTYEVDWLMGWIVADRCSVLGSAKVYVKDMLRYVPIIGWSWVFSSIIFLRRKWDDDKEHIDRQLAVLADYPDPVWLLIFCEGTRFTRAKHEASMEVARKKGLPELRNLLLPRTKGFTYSASRLRGKFAAVYNLTVCFDTENYAEPTLTNMVRGKKILGDMYIERIPMDEVPEDESEAAEFLHKLYRQKDKMLTSYHETGSFTQLSGARELTTVRLPRRFFSLLNTTAWAALVLTPLVRSLLALLLSGSTVQVVSGLLVVALLFFSMYKMIGLTKISRSSSYGQTSRKRE
ncbi:1-acyl-sn-glycerol-3-phosphate acyltransferase gamma-like isoform X2 [Pollicipes pollicipes]|nr:1-acyl-sn-glycerol-3-phosphate acyltransferase gamma-like isoform X2 [Pollicipes pollicipes]XP_037080535.1 1-acyl-sn-glycerol-3-phosphate acyltransferase gamma-like isoform X2 [Pollicipes pollicipes]XP_037080536.1 1-acyl-sn-glycerol-3-phosphate acyltransferase gamma-like isoform X2 [Pollicipes pollicipes]XP_037080537.1 1-acyl-sn-glycerol-3-phosphate acyltransferase gamma-like isoform X2 [Pollicipes pollicipes]